MSIQQSIYENTKKIHDDTNRIDNITKGISNDTKTINETTRRTDKTTMKIDETSREINENTQNIIVSQFSDVALVKFGVETVARKLLTWNYWESWTPCATRDTKLVTTTLVSAELDSPSSTG